MFLEFQGTPPSMDEAKPEAQVTLLAIWKQEWAPRFRSAKMSWKEGVKSLLSYSPQ